MLKPYRIFYQKKKTIYHISWGSISVLRGALQSDLYFSMHGGLWKAMPKNVRSLSAILLICHQPYQILQCISFLSVNGKMEFIHSTLETVWPLRFCVSLTLDKQKWILKNARSLPDGFTQHLALPFQPCRDSVWHCVRGVPWDTYNNKSFFTTIFCLLATEIYAKYNKQLQTIWTLTHLSWCLNKSVGLFTVTMRS